MLTITSIGVPPSPARVRDSARAPFRLGAVQHRWHPDPAEHRGRLRESARSPPRRALSWCASRSSRSRATSRTRTDVRARRALAESIDDGPTRAFAAGLAEELQIPIHASLYERADSEDGLGFNTAIVVAPDGSLLARTRKMHIPVTAGYYEDRYFRPGRRRRTAIPSSTWARRGSASRPAGTSGSPSWRGRTRCAAPRCSCTRPPSAPSPTTRSFDTEPLWHSVIVGNGIANGTFMVAVNRIGTEGELTFYGSSFISDPYGRVLVQAPRDEPAVLVADLDLAQRQDWLELFPFLTTRRPDSYQLLAES